MKVWVVTSSYPRHPAESINAGVIARDVAVSLADQGHGVTVLTPAKPGGIVFDESLEGVEIAWFYPTLTMADLSAARPLDLVRMISLLTWGRRQLKKLASTEPPDVILAFWALPSGMLARTASRISAAPYVVWLLGSDVWKAPRYPGGVRSLSRVLRDAAAVHADGRALASEAERLTGVHVEFLPSCRRLPPAPSERDLPAHVDVLFVGRYHMNKGPDVLLEAFSLLHARRPRFTLRLHGQGPMQTELEMRLRHLGLGGVADVGGPITGSQLHGALLRSRVLAIPSRIESVPLILGDAVQAGRQVVASDVGDMRAIIEPFKIGITVPPEEPAALADALERSLDDPLAVPPHSGPPWLSPDGLADKLLESVA